jgi:FMN phosphatase YigB (HAD superfamily)
MVDSASTTVRTFGDFSGVLREVDDRIAFFESDDGRQAVDAELARAVRGIDFVSVDVFDTVVLRRPVSELRRFYEWGKAVAEHVADGAVTGEDVVVARLGSARAAYRMERASSDGRLEDIVRATLAMIGVRADRLEKAIAIELAHEGERHTHPNRALWTNLVEHVEAGKQVVLFSDMYMSADQVRAILEHHGLVEPGIAIHTSADLPVSKAAGTAFAWMEEELGADPARSLHIGDHRIGDFVRPIERGWRARLWPLADAHQAAVLRDQREAYREITAAGAEIPAGWGPRVEEE